MQAQIKDNPNNANAHNYANVGNNQTEKWTQKNTWE